MCEEDDSVSEKEHFILVYSRQNDPSPQPSLEQLLQDKSKDFLKYNLAILQINDRSSLPFVGTLKLFQDFLRSEFSDENVEFWLACEDYRSSSSADALRRKAWGIYEKFIQPTACREVSVTDSCLVWVQKRQKTTFLCDRMLHWCTCLKPFSRWKKNESKLYFLSSVEMEKNRTFAEQMRGDSASAEHSLSKLFWCLIIFEASYPKHAAVQPA